MPTYLTPGVYVEEVSSGNKPIEGVATAVAAFVGLLPGGPINKPMRISNWTQFANIYTDPQHPENGPFMEGSYIAHAVYGYFQNGGSIAWIIRVGSERGTPAAQAALPAATDKDVEALRVGGPRPPATSRSRSRSPRSRPRRARTAATRPTRSSSPLARRARSTRASR